MNINMNRITGSHDILFLTIDSLRFDVAETALKRGMTPNLESRLSQGLWERRYTPGCFTYPAHHAFFSGFLPVPVTPEITPRLFASNFAGSETIDENTFVFEESNMVKALENKGYKTVCVGGVGFFNKSNEIGSVFPNMFQESYWEKSFGVTSPTSAGCQVDKAISVLSETPDDKRVFMFINFSATHQPNCIFSHGEKEDSPKTQMDALAHVDCHVGRLFSAMEQRRDTFCIVSSDHGTAYGEDGLTGHRQSSPVVMHVPYGEFSMNRKNQQKRTLES